jgi:hypothetical protein
MAKSIAGSIEGASQNFLQLGVMADQTRTSIQTILSLQQAFVQFGSTAGEANSVISTISNSLRSMNDGNLSYYQKFGIQQNKITGEITTNLADGQRALAGLSDATVTQYAELAHIPQSVAELIQHHGEEMQAALEKAQKTVTAFGINQDTVNTQMRYARALNDIYFDLDQAWTVFTTAIAKPLVPALEGLNERLNADAPRISTALGVVGKAFKDDVIDPLASIATGADGLTDDATKINNFKDAVVTGLGGIKEVLDTVKSAFEEVNAISKASQEWAKWAGGIVPGIRSAVDPKRGAEGPGTIDFNAPVVSTPLGRAMYRASPWSDPGTVQPTDPSLHDRPPAIFAPSPPSETTSAAPSTPPSWFKPWTWFGGSRDADKPSPNATPDALETGNGGGFRIPGEDKSIDFADQTVSLKSGGTTVQSGNPLPVRIEKIDPAASGIGGDAGGSVGASAGGSSSGGAATGGPHGHGHWGGAARGAIDRGGDNSASESAVPSDGGNPNLAAIIADARQRAIAHHVDPDLATGIILGESGLHNPGDRRGAWGNSDPSKSGQPGTSYGQFQMRTPGMGDAFLKEHPGGLTAHNWKQQNEYAITQIQRHGEAWARSQWMSMGDAEKRGTSVRQMSQAWMARFGKSLTPPPPAAAPPAPAAQGMSGTGGMSPSGGPWIVGRDGKRYPTDGSGAIDYHVHAPQQGTDKNAAPLSWLGASENAARLMAEDWGGDTIHHHNYDNSMTYHDNRKTNVTVTGTNEPHEVAAAVGSTLEKSFSKSQARQVFNQGAIA